jgi:diguanylate cyclase (GGDEF)-like protein/PAS domain S-box-containing protein
MPGYSRDEIIGKSFFQFIGEANKELGEQNLQNLLSGKIQELEINIPFPDGEIRFLKVTAVPLVINNNISGIYGIAKDVTSEIRLKSELAYINEEYHSLFEHHPDAIYKIDSSGNFTAGNPAAEQLSGYKTSELIGSSFAPLIHPDDFDLTNFHFIKALEGKPQNYSVRIVQKDKTERVVNITNVPMFVEGKIKGVYGIAKDITEKVYLEKKNEHMAYHDYLTNLPNRWQLKVYFKNLVDMYKKGQQFAFVFIDVDRFKDINDTFGHQAGDQLIKKVADHLSDIFPGKFVARIGGDEFIIIIEDTTKSQTETLCKKLLQEGGKDFCIEEQKIYITFSIGIYIHKGDSNSLDEAIKKASAAMKYSKQLGKNKLHFYSVELSELINNKFLLESKLRKAIKNEELMVYYQPKIDLVTNEIVGVEALLRWYDEEYGFIPPTQFIPLAEEINLMDNLGRFVLVSACRQLKKWLDLGVKPIVMCVNISACQFLQDNLIDEVSNTLNNTGIPSQLLSLEITESIAIKFLKQTVEKLNNLRRIGVNIALDDFGTGYSSLNYLKKLPISILKIDRSFIRDIASNLQDQAITRAIITVAHSLGLIVVAEGVENKAQLSFLKNEGCNEVQGYYYSKPIPADEMELLLMEGLKEH